MEYNSYYIPLNKPSPFPSTRHHEAWLQSAQISPHIFRHVVASTLIREGANPHTVKAYLGHASIGTTEGNLEDAADERVMDDM